MAKSKDDGKPHLQYYRPLRHRMAGVYTPNGGYRVARVQHIRWDHVSRRVVQLIVVTYGGSDRYDGWDGEQIFLDDRRQFSGSNSLGLVAANKRDMVSVDGTMLSLLNQRGNRPEDFYDRPSDVAAEDAAAAAASQPEPEPEPEPEETPVSEDFEEDPTPLAVAQIYDPENLPAVSAIQIAVPGNSLALLQKIVAERPDLLAEAGAPGEPRWDLQCPNQITLDLCGYGPASGDLVPTTEIQLVGTISPGGEAAGGQMVAHMADQMIPHIIVTGITLLHKELFGGGVKTKAQPVKKAAPPVAEPPQEALEEVPEPEVTLEPEETPPEPPQEAPRQAKKGADKPASTQKPVKQAPKAPTPPPADVDDYFDV